jgi:lipid-binding SYLF domain-containing protein
LIGVEMKANTWIAVLLVICLTMSFGAAALADDDEDRAEIDAMAKETLKELFAAKEEAKGLYDKAVGYAVFSNVKVQLGLGGGGGKGVAVTKAGDRTYMKMGTGGVGFGIGATKYKVIFLFETEKALKSFVESGWQADTSAQAAAGDASAGAGVTFKQGVAYYQITDKGVIASADITGTKYWKDDDLSEYKEKEKKEKED